MTTLKRKLIDPVLIVDDEAEIRELVVAALAPLELQILEASSAAEALEILEHSKPFLILSDFRMQGMTGLELCQKIGERNSGIPFVLITGYADKELAITSVGSGVSDLLEKPFDLSAVRSVVTKHANKRIAKIEEDERELEEISDCFVEEVTEMTSDLDALILRLEERPIDSLVIDSLFRKIHSVKGGASAIPRGKLLGHFGHGFENALSLVRKGELLPGRAAIDTFLASADLCKQLIATIRAKQEPSSEMEQKASVLLNSISSLKSEVEEAQSADSFLPKADQKVQTSGQDNSDDDSVTVSNDKLDSFMQLSGDFVVAKNYFEGLQKDKLFFENVEASARKMKEFALTLSKLTDQLQDQILSVRRVKLDRALNKLPRMTRQVAQDLGKKIKLEMVGIELAVDKNIAKALSASLTHMIRNSLDHGIEAPEKRRANGKAPEGKITLTASETKGTIHIILEDDGAGINQQRVLSKAIKNGIVSEQAASSLKEAEILELILLPGFSTAEAVSDLSGRGVGMDVVKTSVTALGGSLKIESTEGQGTRFVIQVPLATTVLVENTILIRSEGTLIAIPQNMTSRILKYDAQQTVRIHGRSTVQFDGRTLVVGSYAELCGLAGRPLTSTRTAEPRHVVVVTHRGEAIGITADQVYGQFEAVVRPLERSLRSIPGFKGTALLGDDRFAYVLSDESLFGMLRSTR